MFTRHFKQQFTLFTGAALTALALAACSTASAQPSTPAAIEAVVTAPPVIEIVTQDHYFEAPEQIQAGWVTLHLKNEGQEAHHVQFMRLNDGVSMEQFSSAMQQDPLAALAHVTLTGGPGPVETNGEQVVTVELKPGQYVLADFVPSADGVPHVARGMVATLEVVEGDNTPVQLPEIAGEVKLVDFSIVLPQGIKAGEQVWQITAESTQPHELSLMKLAEGKTVEDVMHWMHAPAGAPPFVNAGGMQGIMPGDTSYLHLNLTPGAYVAICHIPDSESGQEHAALGMVMPFTVE